MKRNDLSVLKFNGCFSMLLMAMAVLLALSVASPRALAQIFPPRGDDSMFSMGVFKVVVNPPYRSLLAPSGPLFGYPGYVSADGRLTSPLLFDFNTQVGRSDPYNRPLGGTVDVGVPTMGLQGYGDYPLIPAAWSGAPAGTREILTRIRSLALRSSSQECRNTDPRVPHPPIDYQFVSAGPAQGVAAKTVGMVQERVVNGAAPPDFPARSFFDVFVEVNLPPVPGTVSGTAFPPLGAILYNDVPLVVTNHNVTNLPPQVIYIHGETTAAPIRFRDNNPPYWSAGDLFGYLVLAGHGTQLNCNTEAGTFLDNVLGPIGGKPANELPVEWPYPTPVCPPPDSGYNSVADVDVIQFPLGTQQILARNFKHGRLNNPINPPSLGNNATYQGTGTELMAEVSPDGGSNWFTAMATGSVAVLIRHTSDMGTMQTFDTEMLQLNLTGTSPLGPFMLRESPTRASVGKHTIRQVCSPCPEPFGISSFFDVFLELSVNGGATWVPAANNRTIRVQLTPGCETNRPMVVDFIADCTNNTIYVRYSEPMDPVSTTDPNNYSVSPGVNVLSVTLNGTGDLATITTTPLACDTAYVVIIRGVKDKCGNFLNPNPFSFDVLCPRCEPMPSPKVSKWSQLPGFMMNPANPNGQGIDRPSDFDWVTLMQNPAAFTDPNWVIAEDFRSDGRPILCVRWWGSYMPGFEPGTTAAGVPNNTFFEDGYVLSFFSDFRPATGGASRPDQLLGTYVAPLSSVKITPTMFIGCDNRRIWQYEVRLQDTCLDHPVPDLATPRAFLEKSNVVYWVAITAEVGHEVIPLYDPSGEIVDWKQKETGKRATTHFWGWHTSPRQVEDRSVMGHVLMQGPEWIYPINLWQPNASVCNELDQAFELLTLPPPCEDDPPTIILVTIDCEARKITVNYSEAMDAGSAGDPGHYALTGAAIDSVVLSADGKTACIFSDDFKCGNNYVLTVRDVKDICGNVLVPNPQTFDLHCPPCPEPKVSKWSQLPGFFTTSANPNFRGGDRPSDVDWITLMQSGTSFGNPNWVIAEDFRSDGRPILCVRWWGSYMPGFEPTAPITVAGAPPVFFEDGYVLSFFSDFRPVGSPSRPDRLLGTYVAPLSAIKITPTQFLGCDSNRIWQYEVALENTCLDHADPNIAQPGAFLERSNVVYWLAITAEVGHRIIPVRDAAGRIVDWLHQASGKRASTHFWGWHTSPKQVEDRSVMGHVLMQGTNWIYPTALWMPNQPFCNEIDQAFELLTRPPPCETNPPVVISVTANCDSNKITVVYNEAMDPATAGAVASYAVSGGVIVNSVTLNAVGDTACLFTTDLLCGSNYTVVVRGVRDICGNPMPITSASFECPPCPQPKVAKWSQLPAYLTSTAGAGRGVDRPSDVDWVTLMQNPTAFVQPNWVIAEDFRSDGRPILCVRWWGSYLRTIYEPTTSGVFFEDGYVISFFSNDQPVAGGPGRPGRLLGSYVAPIDAVKKMPSQFLGCDDHRIWQYEVALKDTCLDHAVAAIARPSAFLEKSNVVYWVAITAEVGHRVIPIRDNHGRVVDWRDAASNKRATEHYWGWHTSPTNRLTGSLMGHVLMVGTNWIYPNSQWMPNPIACNELDQAFELLTGPVICPPPATLNIVRNGNNVVISWVGDFTLQGSPVLANPGIDTEWSDVTTASPSILPIMFNTNRFFRLICP